MRNFFAKTSHFVYKNNKNYLFVELVREKYDKTNQTNQINLNTITIEKGMVENKPKFYKNDAYFINNNVEGYNIVVGNENFYVIPL